MLRARNADFVWPLVVIRPIELPMGFVYHKAPSGPATIVCGLEKTRVECSVTFPAGATFPAGPAAEAAEAAETAVPAVSMAAATPSTVTARYVRLINPPPQGR